MPKIVAALFEDQAAAERALASLRAHGVGPGDLSSFVVNPPGMHHGLPLGGDEAADKDARGGEDGALRGAALGGAVGIAVGLVAAPLVGPAGIVAGIGAGAFVGSLAGAANSMGDETEHAPTTRAGGVMVAVNADRVAEEAVIQKMRYAGASLIETDEGEWRNGAWVDFDPVRPPRNVVFALGKPNHPV